MPNCLSVKLSFWQTVFLPNCPSDKLSFCLTVPLPNCLSAKLFICQTVFLPNCLSVKLSLCQTVSLPNCLSASFYLCLFPTISLSKHIFFSQTYVIVTNFEFNFNFKLALNLTKNLPKCYSVKLPTTLLQLSSAILRSNTSFLHYLFKFNLNFQQNFSFFTQFYHSVCSPVRFSQKCYTKAMQQIAKACKSFAMNCRDLQIHANSFKQFQKLEKVWEGLSRLPKACQGMPRLAKACQGLPRCKGLKSLANYW